MGSIKILLNKKPSDIFSSVFGIVIVLKGKFALKLDLFNCAFQIQL